MKPVLEETTAADPEVLALAAEQEAEVMARYGEDDAGPGPSPSSPAVLVRIDGRAVGCVAVEPHAGEPGEIKRMYVHPDARGRGLSRLLLERAEQIAVRVGIRTLRLETGTEQPEAIALYRRAGYGPIPCYGYWKDDPSTRCFEKVLASS
jgi:GNAT superfamily N-acetyltransferase